MSGSPWPRAIVGGFITVAVGYAIMKGTTPDDKELYNSLSPDLRKQVDLHRSAGNRDVALREQIARARDQSDSRPLWAQSSSR